MGPFSNVVVIGAGVMGAGIAAHCVHAGFSVLLLDTSSATEAVDAEGRKARAALWREKALQAKPPLFSDPSSLSRMQVGNRQDDLHRLRDMDLVIETIVEDTAAKQALFAQIEPFLSDTCVLATNTSGLSLATLFEKVSPRLAARCVGLHFFHPVGVMQLVEVTPGPYTPPALLAQMTHLVQEQLGKKVVQAKDTPNFVANRIGKHHCMVTLEAMRQEQLRIEEVDALTGFPMGHPKSATFRTLDLVGLDTFVRVTDHCFDTLVHDEERALFQVPPFVRDMVASNRKGQKTKAGFYKKLPDGEIQVFDPALSAYRERRVRPEIQEAVDALAVVEDPRERVRRLVAHPGLVGRFAGQVLDRTFAYAARRVGEIANTEEEIDNAMRWGYNWEVGPFALWDALGREDTTKRMLQECFL